VCLTALEGKARRPLPSGLGAASADPDTPLVPAFDVPWLQPFPDNRLDDVADPAVHQVVAAYVRAFEAADVTALVELLTEDAILEMPPVPLWYVGRADYGAFIRRVFTMRGAGWRMVPTRANGQPAVAAYAPDPEAGHRLHTLQVFTVTGAKIAHTVVFQDPSVFAAFELPTVLW
jgi:RNA polymerase sigma-70 factor (ECF subfamily)